MISAQGNTYCNSCISALKKPPSPSNSCHSSSPEIALHNYITLPPYVPQRVSRWGTKVYTPTLPPYIPRGVSRWGTKFHTQTLSLHPTKGQPVRDQISHTSTPYLYNLGSCNNCDTTAMSWKQCSPDWTMNRWFFNWGHISDELAHWQASLF